MLPQRTKPIFRRCFGIAVAGLAGCTAGSGNPNTTMMPSPAGTTRLSPITFSPGSGFMQNADPVEFSVGDGSITASGGKAGTRGQPGLYADDSFAWDFLAGAEGRITLNNLDVVAVNGYWVHPNSQASGATITVMFSGGGTSSVPSVPVNVTGPVGQMAGFFDTVTAPEGESVTSLVFTFDEGANDGDVAALDVLELTVRQP